MARIRRRRGDVEVILDAEERAALGGIVATLSEAMEREPRVAQHTYEDAAMESEFQRWTVPGLVETRNADLEAIRRGLSSGEGQCYLNEEQAMSWVRALNHLRLAAGGLLGADEDGWEQRLGADRLLERPEYRMLVALSWMQEALVDALES
ncbi:MAG: hypothetical protein NVSMB29_10770 [Candidatus Dormibacteria bacterium]